MLRAAGPTCTSEACRDSVNRGSVARPGVGTIHERPDRIMAQGPWPARGHGTQSFRIMASR
jgi:hypothetical protein